MTPRVRTDLVDAYIFRRAANPLGMQFLQLRRTTEPYAETWQPVMGHIEAGESASEAVRRELHEEVGLALPSDAVLGVWALERIHPYFIAPRDEVWLTPRFGVEVRPAWTPTLNNEHDAHRWVARDDVESQFVWRGQIDSIHELLDVLTRPERAALLRVM